ncbi:hypothetical protein H7Y40_02040 [Pedobacter sp.]|nr:hypothetical protein [Candidatus Saccharibacteria bacterium]
MKQPASQPYHLHGIRVLLFGVLLGALFLVRIDSPSLSARSDTSKVLAYATNVSRTDLLNATNAARAQNGLGALALNLQLNNSSQAKGQHMIDYDYWAHVAPDGTQPWYFFTQAGYNYSAAGENLAYGFGTSAAIVDAWMNSPTHKANILGNYTEVGFGYVNGASYQGGENTVVVAHYGTQSSPAPAPAPVAAPTAPASTPSPPPAASAPVASTPASTPVVVATPDPTTTPTSESVPVTTQDSSTAAKAASVIPVATGTTRGINVFQSLKLSNPPAIAIVSIAMTVFVAAGFAVTHRKLAHHAVASGERFIITHPALDTVVVSAISILILTTTISRIG